MGLVDLEKKIISQFLNCVVAISHTLLTVLPLVRPWTSALVALPQVDTLSSVLARHIQAAVPVAAAGGHINSTVAQPFLWDHELPVHKHILHAANECWKGRDLIGAI